jgi:hypothetical protein
MDPMNVGASCDTSCTSVRTASPQTAQAVILAASHAPHLGQTIGISGAWIMPYECL